jgi:hypothetical protein
MSLIHGSSTSSLPQPLSNFNISSNLKLTRENHPLWSTLIIPYLEGQSLFGYVNGDTPCPPQFLESFDPSTGTSTQTLNPSYTAWYQQDKLILSLLLSTVSESLLTHVVGLKTSREVWLTLERMFAAQSQARVMHSRYQLATLKKGSSSISGFFQKAQSLAHTLAAIDEPLKDSELISYILAGLGSDYDPLITSITTRIDPVSLEDLYGHLLTHEQRLDHANTAGDLAVPSVHVAQRSTNSGRPSHPFRGRGRGGRVHGSFQQHSSNTTGSSRQHSPNTSSNRPVCQVCSKPGHTALKCYHRFDHSYKVDSAPPSAFPTIPPGPSDLNWYPDTGSTNHLTNDLSNLTIRADAYHGPDQIRVGNGQGLEIRHTGLASLSTPTRFFKLPHLLHVPHIQKNLISVHQFTNDNHVFIEFHPSVFYVKDLRTGTLLLKGPSRGGLYPWPTSSLSGRPQVAFVGERVSFDQWHHRLGHPASPLVQRILSRNGLPVTSHNRPSFCSSCPQGKLHKQHFGVTASVSKQPLDLLFLDVWGPAPVLSSNNKRYFLCVVDDFSKYLWIFPMSCKSDVCAIFANFKRLVENFFSHTIKAVQTDGGGEFIPLQRILTSSGISYRQTCPHTHHQNGSVERRHRHIVDTGLTLLSHSGVPFKYWDDAFDTACFLINRLPTATRSQSSFELLFGKAPDYRFLKTFGCECWPYLRPYNSHKFSFRSKSCLFLGYSKPHLGYKCLDLSTNRLYIA